MEKDIMTKLSESFFEVNKKIESLQDYLNKMFPGKSKVEFNYRVIPENEIDEKKLQRVKKVIDYCKKKLKLDNVQIDWIEPVYLSEAAGYRIRSEAKPIFNGCFFTDENAICLRADAPLKKMEFAVCHEMHHLWFKQKYEDQYPYEKESYMWERTANEFAEKVLSELWDLEHKDFPLPTFLSKN